MGPLGMTEIVFIFLLALLLFGPGKLPELGRLIGKGLSEFRRASNDLRSTVEDEMRDYDRKVNIQHGDSNLDPSKTSPDPQENPKTPE